MFRAMRREKQQLSNREAVRILEEGKTGILAVISENGYPYTVPLNYVYYDGKIYFHSAKSGHKIDAIRDCEKVSFCVISKDDVIKEKLTTAYESAIVFGRARILTQEQEIVEAAKRFSLKYNEDEELADREIKNYWNSLCCVEIEIDHLTAKAGLELMGQKE